MYPRSVSIRSLPGTTLLRALVVFMVASGISTAGGSRAAWARTWEVPADGSLATVLSNAVDGDRIHVSRGVYQAPDGGWLIRKSIELYGDGAGNLAADTFTTRLRPFESGDPVLVLQPPDSGFTYTLDNVYIHDLMIRPNPMDIPTSYSSTGHGIVWKQQGLVNRNLGLLRLARLSIWYMAGDGINIVGSDDPSTYAVGATLSDIHVDGCLGNGLKMYKATLVDLFGGYYRTNRLTGCEFSSCQDVKLFGVALEGNDDNQGKPQLEMANVVGFNVEGCHFEEFSTGMRIGSFGGHISGCFFSNASGAGTTGIAITNTTAKAVVVASNTWSNVDVLVTIADSDQFRACTIFPQAIYSSVSAASKIVVPEAADRGHIVFPATNHTASITAGIELPRLSGARRDSMAAVANGGTRREGLVLYNDAANKINYWDGSKWQEAATYFGSKAAENAPIAGIAFPSIATSTRDSLPSPANGSLIYNSTSHRMEHYDGTKWIPQNPSMYGTEVNLTGRTAAIDTTTLLTSPSSGVYRVTLYAVTTTQLSNNQGHSINLTWTDSQGQCTAKYTLQKDVGSTVTEVVPIHVNNGNVKYSSTGALASGAFTLRIRVEAGP